MSIWCNKEFLLSCDVDLDLKIYVGALQLRNVAALLAHQRECYVSLQVADGCIPLHPFARSTGLCFVSGSQLVWDEWLALPVKIKDLTDRSQLIVKLWGVGNECFAGASLRVFDRHLSLRKGHVPLAVWQRGVDLTALPASTDLSGDTPLSLLIRPNRSAAMLRFLEAYAQDRSTEVEVREAMSREGRGDAASSVQVCNVEVPATPWTDRMLAAQIQRELLSASAEAGALANETRLLGQETAHAHDGHTHGGVQPPNRLADAFLVGTAALHFPLFPFPILFEDAVYTSAGPGEVAGQQGLSSQGDLPGMGGADPAATRMPPLVMQPTVAGAAALAGWEGKEGGDAEGRAYWGEQLSVIWDPEAGAIDNPSDAKYHKLVRAGTQGADASTIKPTRAELAKIQAIINAPDSTGIGAKPSQEAADLLWRLRYSLTGNKRALVKFAQTVDWADEAEAAEAAQLFSVWVPIDTEDALRLLCPEFPHHHPRVHAVSALRRASDDEVLLYLLQLVQALRYEPALPSTVSGHGHAHHRPAVMHLAEGVASGTAAAGVIDKPPSGVPQPTLDLLSSSPLTAFLVERACASTEVAVSLHWFLIVAMDDANAASAQLFSAVHGAFNACLASTPGGRAIANVRDAQVAMLVALAKVRDEATSNKKDSVKAKIEKLNLLLTADGPYSEVVALARPLPLPCAPSIPVTGIVPGMAHMFKSALYPVVVTFKVHPTAALDWASTLQGAGVCGLTVAPAAKKAAQAYKAAQQASASAATLRSAYAGHTPVKLVLDTAGSALTPSAGTPVGGAQGAGLALHEVVAAAAAAAGEASPATYRVIFKQGDDLRQDQLIIQLLRICDAQLKRVGLDLRLTPYSVVATGREAGMLEMVLGSLPVSAVLENATYARGGNPVQAYLREKNPDEKAEYGIAPDAMDTYVKSCAGYAAITYILGIGDRHLDNIMLASDGRLFHIDFGFIFGRDPKPLPPPMRITKEMIDGMGGPASSNYDRFKRYTCSAYQLLRRHASLITVLLNLMRDAGIADLGSGQEASTVIAKLHDKFRVDMDDEAADSAMLELIDNSVSALAPAFFEVLHKIRVAMR